MYEAIYLPKNRKVAVKTMNGIFNDLTDCKRILREIMLLRTAKSTYIVKLLDIIRPLSLRNFDKLCLVLECADSDVKKLCKSPVFLEEIHIKTVIYNILMGLKYLHSAGILHRDMKTANVLVNEDCTTKLCDFGLARLVRGIKTAKTEMYEMAGELPDECERHENPLTRKKRSEIYHCLIKTKDARRLKKRDLTSHVVTRWYRAPELILLEKNYDEGVDLWSLGCILGELLGMMKSNCENPTFRCPLFQGSSCFPLSPSRDPLTERGETNANHF